MGTQGYRDDYRAAFSCANDQLDHIYEEYHLLQLRKQHLEGVLSALEPMLYSGQSATEDFSYSQPEHFEPTSQLESIQESIEEPLRPAMHFEEPAQHLAPPPFAPSAEAITDPLQLRINRALGLAVA